MITARPNLQDVDRALSEVSHALSVFTPQLTPRRVGQITGVFTAVVTLPGLPNVGSKNSSISPAACSGIAIDVDEDELDVVLLGDHSHLRAGDEVSRARRVMDVGPADRHRITGDLRCLSWAYPLETHGVHVFSDLTSSVMFIRGATSRSSNALRRAKRGKFGRFTLTTILMSLRSPTTNRLSLEGVRRRVKHWRQLFVNRAKGLSHLCEGPPAVHVSQVIR